MSTILRPIKFDRTSNLRIVLIELMNLMMVISEFAILYTIILQLIDTMDIVCNLLTLYTTY